MKIIIDENSPRPIYEQIMFGFIQMIAFGDYSDDEKLPSVRDISVFLKVNPNTVTRAFFYLSNEKIIYLKRGVGNFVTPGAMEDCKQLIKNRVEENISRELELLESAGFSKTEITKLLNNIWSRK